MYPGLRLLSVGKSDRSPENTSKIDIQAIRKWKFPREPLTGSDFFLGGGSANRAGAGWRPARECRRGSSGRNPVTWSIWARYERP